MHNLYLVDILRAKFTHRDMRVILNELYADVYQNVGKFYRQEKSRSELISQHWSLFQDRPARIPQIIPLFSRAYAMKRNIVK